MTICSCLFSDCISKIGVDVIDKVLANKTSIDKALANVEIFK